MEHDPHSARLTELVTGALGETETRAGWEHVARCRDCQDVLGTIDRLRRLGRRPVQGTTAHPLADEIVQYAIDPEQLETADLARIGAHLQTCSDCRAEVALTRRADREALSWWRRLGTMLGAFRIESAAPVLAPALAALVIVLAYPAYQGAVRFPEARRAQEQAARRIASLEARQQELGARIEASRTPTAGWSGPIRLLYLPAATRGASQTPTVSIAPGQPYQTIVVDAPFLREGAGARTLSVVIERAGGGVAWRHQATADDLWDAHSRAAVILAPAPALAPGPHALVIREADGAERYRGAFRVAASTTR
jgi:hypothetical protein